ncbi:Glycine--tRNA ligase beta subunit [Pelagimonas phthalicica]|uniref:Glycine--tRNA ligase beta subunit n=1 Tax=Pelagimonas phthalicica TaxID=1037362 RepID=A0A238JG66_9RHOB|nr:glycine--tRNA ligase subunit beta [Pelagimonas phthalicica]TDS91902.1 glycyl-tRNA synthetase beta chain [Pelagimonas phthalicica]SMX28952.1 Glycine--tRNA ligase beta subunit [Pelagimonas phthalicica]
MPDLLIELFSEEIPARMQGKAAADLQKLVTDGLVEAGLTYAGARAFSTPRRLTLALDGLLAQSPTLREERRGPKVGAPDKALEGFMRGAGVTRDQLEEREDKKGSFYYATVVTEGRPAAEIVAEVLEKTIRNFPWPKSMRWGAGSLRWVRPLHRITCILSDEAGASVVSLDIDGIVAGQQTEGHRFMGGGAFTVTSFEDYEAQLKRNFVVLSSEERQEAIWNDATNAAFALGLEVVEDKGLLREVAGLVEWPVVLMGDIEEDFLGLPPEVLQTSMKEHQKFFSVRNPKTGRIEKWITVSNIETADHGATILAGNQKVLAARLADAKFFWENDLRVAQRQGLSAWTDRLSNVTFHRELGSQAERIDRIAALAREIAPAVGADADLAEQAARVAKADLSSEMVYEFPELQGLMGRYYAQAAGLDASVAAACEEHYSPLGPSDDVPTAPVSVAVALADKLDTLTGFWAIDEKPTGSKDPYALRRAALGVIRLVLANSARMKLDRFIDAQLVRHKVKIIEDLRQDEATALIAEIAEHGVFGAAFRTVLEAGEERTNGFSSLEQVVPDTSTDLLSFFHDRLKVHLRDEGIRHDVIDACLAMEGSDDIRLLVTRAEALAAFMKTDDGENLVQGFKRANNILSQAEEKDGVEYSYGADVKFAEEDSEKALFAALDAAEAKITPAMQGEDFAAAMEAMASLRAPIDAFFEAVQVNSENSIIRRNRLNLLSRIRTICSQVADLSKLEG